MSVDTDEDFFGFSDHRADVGALEASVEGDKLLSSLTCSIDWRGCSARLGVSGWNEAWLEWNFSRLEAPGR